MDILQWWKGQREGNDCLLRFYISLVKVDESLWCVTYITEVLGSCFNEAASATSRVFTSLDKAEQHYNDLVEYEKRCGS